jgi:hypothetical protein
MTIALTEKANEKSSYIVYLTFKDEEGFEVVPNSINWDLTDNTGATINSRSNVSETPATNIAIALYGLDLGITGGVKSRVLTVKAPYDSDLGTLPFNEEFTFEIEDLLNIT